MSFSEYLFLSNEGAFSTITVDEDGTKTSEDASGMVIYSLDLPIFLDSQVTLETALYAFKAERLFTLFSSLPDRFTEHMAELENDRVEFDNSIEFLEVFRIVSDWGDPKLGVDVSSDFHGVGFPTKAEDSSAESPEGERITYALEFTPLYDLKHLPVRIDRNTFITHSKEEAFTNMKSEAEDFNPTIFELVSAILYELTWCGTIEQRNAKSAELSAMAKDVEKAKESGDWSGFKEF